MEKPVTCRYCITETDTAQDNTCWYCKRDWQLGWGKVVGDDGLRLGYPNPKAYVSGFCAALADTGGAYASIEDAILTICFHNPRYVEECLKAAEELAAQDGEWMRWPDLPIRNPE